MATEERTDPVDVLEKSRRDFHDAAANVPEPQAGAKPAADRWSVIECVEHVTIVEERLLSRLHEAPRAESPKVDKQKEASLAARIPDRTTRAEAPEAVRPTGRFTSLAEALAAFDAMRARTIEFARNRTGDLYWLALEHPRLGSLNGGEFIVFIAGHSRRHAAQIREVKVALGIA